MNRERDRDLSKRLHARVYAKLDALNRHLLYGRSDFSAEDKDVLQKHSKIWMQLYGRNLVLASSVMTAGFLIGAFAVDRSPLISVLGYVLALAGLGGIFWLFKSNLRQVNTRELANLSQVARFDDLEAAYADAMVVLHESILSDDQIEGMANHLNSLLTRVDALDVRLESLHGRIDNATESDRVAEELGRLRDLANAGDAKAAAGIPLLERRAARRGDLQRAIDQIESEKIIIRNTFRNVAESIEQLEALSQPEVAPALSDIESQINALNLQSQGIEAAIDEVIQVRDSIQ